LNLFNGGKKEGGGGRPCEKIIIMAGKGGVGGEVHGVMKDLNYIKQNQLLTSMKLPEKTGGKNLR